MNKNIKYLYFKFCHPESDDYLADHALNAGLNLTDTISSDGMKEFRYFHTSRQTV